MGTCNLTSKNKKYVSLKSENDEEVDKIISKYNEIIIFFDMLDLSHCVLSSIFAPLLGSQTICFSTSWQAYFFK
jgi:hypothetical protein